MRLATILLALACTGCGAALSNAGQSTASGVITAVTSDDSQKKLDGLVTNATKAARDEALGPNTDAAIQKLWTDVDARIQATLKETGANTQAQLNTLVTQTLQDKVRQTIRLSLDEALGTTTLTEADALREELVGAPLQKDVDALIDSTAPHLNTVVQQAVNQAVQGTIVPLKATADAEAAKWKPIAIGFAVGTTLLILCIVVLVHTLHSHRKVIETLAKAQRA